MSPPALNAFSIALVLARPAAATGLFTLLDLDPAESAVGQSTDLAFYLVLFAVSTVVAVPLEELFFRGIVRPHLEERFHAAVAIPVASLLFVVVHLTENLFVPLIGHVSFNGIQILLQALEVAV